MSSKRLFVVELTGSELGYLLGTLEHWLAPRPGASFFGEALARKLASVRDEVSDDRE